MSEKYYNTIGVFGHLGMVGGTTLRYFKDQGCEVTGFDPREAIDVGQMDKIYNADLIFVCVPTPFNWEKNYFDGSILGQVLTEISKNSKKENPVVVIKSTMPVGSTERFQKTYPNLKLLFNPEFLSEATCDNDFRNPDRQFIGYTEKSYDEATKVLNSLPESPYGVIMPSKEAELLKYINNVHGTIEIMESNMYYEVCKEEGLDYDRVLKAMLASKWVGVPMGRHYRVIFHKNKRGFGGKCFPKDISAWIEYLDKKHIDNTLPKAVLEMNKRILKEQGYTLEESEKL